MRRPRLRMVCLPPRPQHVWLTSYLYSDYNFVRSGDKCVPSGLERIPNTMCTTGRPDETYMGSSGYRLIAGDKCDKGKGVRKDEPVSKSCSQGTSIGCLSV